MTVDDNEGLTEIIEEILATGLIDVQLSKLKDGNWTNQNNDSMYRKFFGKFCAVYRPVNDVNEIYELSHISYLRTRTIE